MISDESSFITQQESSRWRSIKIMHLVLFLNSTGFSIILPSVWPYLQELSPTVNYSFLGLAVAGYSVGQLIASPSMGKWSTIRGKVTLPLQVCLCIGVIGNLIYGLARLFKATELRLWCVVVGRVISGIGAGCIAIARSYQATVTTQDERTLVVSKGSMAQALGFIVGPGLSLLASLVKNGVVIRGVEISQYTLPAFISVILISINIVLVAAYFREGSMPAEFMVNSLVQSSEVATLRVKWPGVAVCNLLFFIAMASFTICETLNTPILQAEMGLSQSEAIKWSSVLLTTSSVFSLLTFSISARIGRRFGERKMMGIAFLLSALAYALMFPLGPGHIPRIQIAPLKNITIHNATEEVTGCSWQNEWCTSQKRLNIYQFIVANAVLLFSYPLAVVMIMSRTSKILGPHPQGTVMGVLTGVGCLARTIGPAIFSSIFQAYGPPVVSIVMVCICLCGSLSIVISHPLLNTFDSRIRSLNAEIFT